MGSLFSTRRAVIGSGGTYSDKVLGYDPAAYWPLTENTGTVAECLVNPAQNGTYSSDVSTWPVGVGIGDGNTAPGFDGANDFVNVLTATMTAAFNGAAGTLLQWTRVSAAGIWTDGQRRDSIFLFTDGNNYVFQGRNVANNTWSDMYNAAGTTETVSPGGLSDTGWVPTVITWSKAAEEYRLYRNGAQVGATQVALGIWAGALTVAIIGATTAGAANPWSGWIARTALWPRALSAAAVLDLSVV